MCIIMVNIYVRISRGYFFLLKMQQCLIDKGKDIGLFLKYLWKKHRSQMTVFYKCKTMAFGK